MQKFDPQLVQVMRNALEEVMTKVPLEYSSSSTKAYLAECILKAAAQGQTSYDQLVAAAADQIDQIQVVLSRSSEEDTMNHAMYSTDRHTYLQIVVIILLCAFVLDKVLRDVSADKGRPSKACAKFDLREGE